MQKYGFAWSVAQNMQKIAHVYISISPQQVLTQQILNRNVFENQITIYVTVFALSKQLLHISPLVADNLFWNWPYSKGEIPLILPLSSHLVRGDNVFCILKQVFGILLFYRCRKIWILAYLCAPYLRGYLNLALTLRSILTVFRTLQHKL